MEKKILYFERTGKDNSMACLDRVKDAVREGGQRHMVVVPNLSLLLSRHASAREYPFLMHDLP